MVEELGLRRNVVLVILRRRRRSDWMGNSHQEVKQGRMYMIGAGGYCCCVCSELWEDELYLRLRGVKSLGITSR